MLDASVRARLVLSRLRRLTAFSLPPHTHQLIFTGTSQYEFDLSTEKVVRHSDTWDSIENQEYFSVEGLRDLAGQVANFGQTPDLETPQYVTLKRLADYEVRKYDSFLVCQVRMMAPTHPFFAHSDALCLCVRFVRRERRVPTRPRGRDSTPSPGTFSERTRDGRA